MSRFLLRLTSLVRQYQQSVLGTNYYLQSHYASSFFQNVKGNKLMPYSEDKSNEEWDLIQEQMMKAKSSKSLLELVSINYNNMDQKHLICAFELLGNNSKSFDMEEMLSNSSFELLCQKLIQQARFLTLSDSIALLKVLARLPIPPSSRIIQSILQMIKANVNDISVSNVSFIHLLLKILEKKESTALVEALILALPIVMKLNLKTQIHALSLKNLIECLNYSIYHRIGSDNVHLLLETLIKKKSLIRDHPEAVRLFFILGRLKNSSEHINILYQVVNEVLIRYLKEIPINQVLSMLNHCELNDIYLMQFFDAVVNRLISESWELWQISAVISTFIKMRHINVDLMETISEHIVVNVSALNEDPRVSLFNFVELFAMANCIPSNSELVFQCLSQCDKKITELEENSPAMLLSLLCNLVTLNYYPAKLINTVMNPTFITLLTSTPSKTTLLKSVYEKLILIDETLVRNGFADKSYLSDEFRENAVLYCFNNHPPCCELEEKFRIAIEQGLGGSQYVLPEVWTKSGICIDNLIVLRGGKYPIAINFKNESNLENSDSITYVEDLPLPMDVNLVAILPIYESQYASNLPRVKSKVACKYLLLEKLGYSILKIHLSQWDNLAECEKIPYLTRELQTVVPKLVTISNN